MTGASAGPAAATRGLTARHPRPGDQAVRWEGGLPPGYRLREDADLLILLRPDGSLVAAFSAPGVDPLEVIIEAWEDYE